MNPQNFPPTSFNGSRWAGRISRLPKLLKVLVEMRSTQPPYSEATLETYLKQLARMDRDGVDLDNPAEALLYIATKQTWGSVQKAIAPKAYKVYAKVYGLQLPVQKLKGGVNTQPKSQPYIPDERLLNLLINKPKKLVYRTAFSFLKDTGLRVGELLNLKV